MEESGFNDTIVAISTPLGESGIGIVRISGKEAFSIADKVFLSKDGKKPSAFKAYTTHYGWVADKSEVIDEVILTAMRSPRSYTKEDVVEINCHGGIVAMRRVLDLVLENGARLACPGEFTKRAFLNGRIDLTQAEAVLDIIRAKTDSALKIGSEQLRGILSREINKIRKNLLEILSVLEANIDFPEEEISPTNLEDIKNKLNNINKELKDILAGSRRGRILREGINVVICGKPNVGKSSLLNTLLRQERAIVSSVPGTTRDTIEEIMDIRGIPVKIVDTAGILEPRDLLERKAVQRSKRCLDLADLVILLFDGSQRLSQEDNLLIRKLKLKKKNILAVINKIDLRQKVERDKLVKIFARVVDISAKKNKNINLLEDTIADLFYRGRIKNPELLLVSNLRHIEIMRKVHKLIVEALDLLDHKLPIEFIAQNLKDALSSLDEILGRKFSEDLLDKIFSDFCIGK